MSEILARLREPFKPDEVKQRPVRRGSKQMLDYVSIDATINRLLDVLGMDWDFEVNSTTVTPMMEIDEDTKYLAVVTGTLSVVTDEAKARTYHGGVGADVATDPDKAVKTALAEALKKAGHQLGVGLYLWDAEERAKLDLQRKAQGGNVTALKTLVRDAAVDGGAEATAEGIAKFHGVKPSQLNDSEVLRRLAGLAA